MVMVSLSFSSFSVTRAVMRACTLYRKANPSAMGHVAAIELLPVTRCVGKRCSASARRTRAPPVALDSCKRLLMKACGQRRIGEWGMREA